MITKNVQNNPTCANHKLNKLLNKYRRILVRITNPVPDIFFKVSKYALVSQRNNAQIKLRLSWWSLIASN